MIHDLLTDDQAVEAYMPMNRIGYYILMRAHLEDWVADGGEAGFLKVYERPTHPGMRAVWLAGLENAERAYPGSYARFVRWLIDQGRI